ncbi:MAG TPA: DUF6491 family protein [Allosphingosinicella sp.]|jgi:hypothetical protein
MKKTLTFALAAAASLGGALPAAAQPESRPAIEEREASIPFLHIGRARTFRAIDDHTLYLRATNRQWYRVTTLGMCRNLQWAHNIGVDTFGSAFDRNSFLIVDGERCALRSVVRSEEPPKRSRRGSRSARS